MQLGFTGSRKGMSDEQSIKVFEFLSKAKDSDPLIKVILHHGDCIGADAMTHYFGKALGMYIIKHPPKSMSTTDQYIAHCEGADEIRDPLPHIDRNYAIVDETDFLLAMPSGSESSQPRSGTWATIRYAIKQDKSILVVFPDGLELRYGE